MTRPHWRTAVFAAASGAVGLSILAGCATRQSGLSASDETARYLQNARGRYVMPGPPGDPWGPYIREASNCYDIPESWIRALMRQESGGSLYRNGRLITSSAGAMGLMQVMPATYAELRARHNLGPDPFDPHDNIMAGVGYMREMYDMYGSPGFLAAYNAGPNRLDDYLANQRGLPDETRHYVASIGPSLRYAQPKVHSPAEQFAMNQLPLNIPPGPRYGYGSVQVPAVQVASASPAYARPVFSQAPVQSAYVPPAQPRALAWAQTPHPFTRRRRFSSRARSPSPNRRSRFMRRRRFSNRASSLSPNRRSRFMRRRNRLRPTCHLRLTRRSPFKATFRRAQPPVQTYAPPPPRVQVARAGEREEAETSYRRSHSFTHQFGFSRVAMAIPSVAPRRSGGGLHLISSAMASEVYTTMRQGRKTVMVPISISKAEHPLPHPATAWRLHASGPVQAPPLCHKNVHGKTICGSDHI